MDIACVSDRTLQDLLDPSNKQDVGRWDEVFKRAYSHPHEAQRLWGGKTLLQIAVTSNAPYHVISALVEAYPRATLRSPYMTSALFDACRCNAADAANDIIALILQTSLEQRKIANISNFAPFTWMNDIQVSLSQVELMLDIHPAGATDRDDYLGGVNALNQLIDDWDWMVHDVSEYPNGGTRSKTLDVMYQKLQMLLRAKDGLATKTSGDTYATTFLPLHSILRYCLYEQTPKTDSCSGYDFQGLLTIIKFMAKVDAEQFAARDSSGNLPLHVILRHRQSGIPASDELTGMVLTVLGAHPLAIKQKDAGGRLPLHLAASNQAISPACGRILMDAAPQVLLLADGVSGLYPFQAAASTTPKSDTGAPISTDTSRLELVHKMLLGAPHVLNHDVDGKSKDDGNADGGDIVLRLPYENMCRDCKENASHMKEELDALRERTILLERENMKLRGFAGDFGSPGNIRKRSKSAWV